MVGISGTRSSAEEESPGESEPAQRTPANEMIH